MVKVDTSSDIGCFQPTWEMAGVDVGEPVRIPQFSDKSYGMWGLWGGGTISLQGSWDKSNSPNPASWLILYESDNTTAITNTANAAGVVLENPIWIRPTCTAAVATVRVTINCTKGTE